MSHMKRALLVLLLAGGCSFQPDIPPPPDVMGAWHEVYMEMGGASPSLWFVDAEEHRHGQDFAFVPDLQPETLSHALTHVWAMRQAKGIGLDALLQIHDEKGAWDMLAGDPNHTMTVWAANGQPGALERTALEYLRTHR